VGVNISSLASCFQVRVKPIKSWVVCSHLAKFAEEYMVVKGIEHFFLVKEDDNAIIIVLESCSNSHLST
jgi:hypothetical protein